MNQTFQTWKGLQQDRRRVKELAGSVVCKPDEQPAFFRSVQAKVERLERLQFMANCAFNSEAYRTRRPNFAVSEFFTLFGGVAAQDWLFLGVVIQPEQRTQPGKFVAHLSVIQQKLIYYKGKRTRMLNQPCSSACRAWLARHQLTHDSYGRRR